MVLPILGQWLGGLHTVIVGSISHNTLLTWVIQQCSTISKSHSRKHTGYTRSQPFHHVKHMLLSESSLLPCEMVGGAHAVVEPSQLKRPHLLASMRTLHVWAIHTRRYTLLLGRNCRAVQANARVARMALSALGAVRTRSCSSCKQVRANREIRLCGMVCITQNTW